MQSQRPSISTQTTSVTITIPGTSQQLSAKQTQGVWVRVWQQFRRNYLAMLGLCVVLVLVAMALVADFLANDKPLYLVYQGRTYFPAPYSYLVALSLAQWPPDL